MLQAPHMDHIGQLYAMARHLFIVGGGISGRHPASHLRREAGAGSKTLFTAVVPFEVFANDAGCCWEFSFLGTC